MSIVRTAPPAELRAGLRAESSPARREALRREPADPILKWAGGKGRLLEALLARLPARWDRYFEPFFGGGALFFRLAPARARLADLNAELVNVYRCVRDDVDGLVEHLGRHVYEKDYYYAMRARDPREMTPLARASRMIYLNRTCFNGLYRVNRRGHFNVPFGRYDNPSICQEDKLRAASRALQGVAVEQADYASTLAEARAGDFVYLDPPYQPLTRTASFTSYTAAAFDEDEQRRLAETFAALDARGVRCMLSNSDTPLVRELYGGWRVDEVEAPRAISRTAEGRRPVTEVIVRNYA